MFFGNESDLIDLVFDIFDFNSDNMISAEDLKIVLNYLPNEICAAKLDVSSNFKSFDSQSKKSFAARSRMFELSDTHNLDDDPRMTEIKSFMNKAVGRCLTRV